MPTRGFNESILEHARYKTAAAQSIPNNTVTIVNFGTVVLDPYSRVTTGAAWKYTCVADGLYHVSAVVTLGSAAVIAGQVLEVILYKNGAIFSDLHLGSADAASAALLMSGGGTDLISLVKTDYIDIRVYQNSGGARVLLADGNLNYISISRIGRAI